MKFLNAVASSSKSFPYHRQLSTSIRSAYPSFSRPGPPPLPPKDQAEFEALLKANESVGATPAVTAPSDSLEKLEQLKAGGLSGEHRDLRRGPKKDFEGDENPMTGEMGGPKTDPFKAGDQDWQYGGRVTVGWPYGVAHEYRISKVDTE